jgi:Protein of unknown function (DUF3828)
MVLAALLAMAPAPVAAADSPRAFLTRLYARYESGNLKPFPRQEQVYAPELVRQMRLNAKLYGPEQVGLIDYDPVCQCQDVSELKARIFDITPTGRGKAEARVSIGFGDGTVHHEIRVNLIRAAAGWRIADIATREQLSLLADLQRDNQKMARGKR